MIHRWLTNCVKVLWRDKDPPLPTIPVDHHVTPTCYFILLAGVATPLLTDSTFLRCLSATAFPSDDHHGQTKIGRDLNFPRNLFFLCCSSMESVSNPTARHDCRLRRGGGRAWDREKIPCQPFDNPVKLGWSCTGQILCWTWFRLSCAKLGRE